MLNVPQYHTKVLSRYHDVLDSTNELINTLDYGPCAAGQ